MSFAQPIPVRILRCSHIVERSVGLIGKKSQCSFSLDIKTAFSILVAPICANTIVLIAKITFFLRVVSAQSISLHSATGS